MSLHRIQCRVPAVDLGAAHISGMLDLGGLAASAVGAVGATIGGELNLDGATLINEDGDALNLDAPISKEVPS